LVKSRRILEKKAQLYNDLVRGKRTIDQVRESLLYVDETKIPTKRHRMREDDDDGLLVDFELKPAESDEEDPWIEYQDEFGRMRTVHQSQLPQVLQEEPELLSDDMRRERQRRLWEEQALKDMETGPLHYDAQKEIRTMGVGFYQFARDEDERQKQQGELNALRQETEVKRAQYKTVKEKRDTELQARWQRVYAARRKRDAGGDAVHEMLLAIRDDVIRTKVVR
jgi:hypothetical protein